jgi:hypothetical protein
MGRKVVKVYITPEQRKLLQAISSGLGMAESDVLRTAFMEYAKSLGLVAASVQLKL